jgi:D-aminoacyl-tRNA deacylase
MRAVIQRVNACSVSVEGRLHSEIGRGLLVLVAVARGDGPAETAFMADKVLNLRIFPDENGKMNLSVLDIGGELMVVSQFTLLGDCRRGRRPSFVAAEEPEAAETLYLEFASSLAASGLEVQTGEFGAMMSVELENWGPVTLVIDTPRGG